jgi:selenocysteine-specific elongation factor
MASRQINITLGTAGHIDHGKTALVRLLTGCETDKLKEEIERGMSIELGFAPCLVAGMEVGIVDVPGHEHFIKTMVAGAMGMDGVLLVVAADDGIMPQTLEHLDILTLLGIRHGFVALTKIDRVGPERVAEVAAAIEVLVHGTFLEGTPICPLSNITGDGFDPFLKALQELVRSIPPKRADGIFRLPVEKTFSIKGHGTVITGIPVAGSAHVGDEIVLLPQDLAGRVSGIQVYGQQAEALLAGQCAAINIRHWEAKAISRGSTLTAPGFFAPADWYVCDLRLLPHEAFTLKNAAKVKFHTGTSEVLGSAYLVQGDVATAGQQCLIQMRLDQPLVAGPGDRFILRSASPPMTIGGGTIIEAVPRRLKRQDPLVQADLVERAAAVRSEETFAEYALKTAPAVGAVESELAHRVKTPLARMRELLARMTADGRAVLIAPGLYAHRATIEATEKRILAILAEFHQQSPESPGPLPEELLEASGLAREILQPLVARLKAAGRVVATAGRLALPEHKMNVRDEDREAMDSLDAIFRARPFDPPSPAEAVAAAGLAEAQATKALRLLVEQQRLVQVAPDMLFHREAVDRAKELLTAFIKKEGNLESVKFKYILNTTRKFAIPLLDYFDRVGVTRAVGHTRYLKAVRKES